MTMERLKNYVEQFVNNIHQKNFTAEFFGIPLNETSLQQGKNIQKLAQLLHLIDWIMRLEKLAIYSTKRDIYYTNVELYRGKQAVLNKTVQKIATRLDMTISEMHLKSSSKGLIHGPITINQTDGSVLDCVLGNELLIPSKELISSISAECPHETIALVIEKDAVFQLLVQNKQILSKETGKSIIFITVSYILGVTRS